MFTLASLAFGNWLSGNMCGGIALLSSFVTKGLFISFFIKLHESTITKTALG